MDNYELVLRSEDGETVRHPVTSDGLTAGRLSTCEIPLNDSMVSRKHARIWVEDDTVFVEDLGSMNGLRVNGRRVWRGCLLDGDELVIGEQVMVLHRRGATSIMDGGSSISLADADTLVDGMVESGGSQRLVVLYKASQLLGSVFDMDELLDRTLGLVMEAIPARRGYILTRYEGETEPVVRASRLAHETHEDLPISENIIDHVFASQESVLTSCAKEDSRFGLAKSAVQHDINAAMCVPLQAAQSLLGVVYVDSGSLADPEFFSGDELELLTAIGRVVGVAVDNARMHAEKVETERLAAIGQATAGIGHCVKNILAGAKGGGEYIDLGIAESEWRYVKKGRSLLGNSVGRIEDIVVNLLTFSRGHEPEYTRTDVNGLVAEAVQVAGPKAEKAHVALAFERGGLDTVFMDGRSVFRVVLNLVTNAIEACQKRGGEVTVKTRQEATAIRIDVCDTGEGIPDDFRDKLFLAFSSTKGSAGTGLGLACSQKIARSHGGEITVDSVLDKGSTFTLHLPIRHEDPTKQRETTRHHVKTSE